MEITISDIITVVSLVLAITSMALLKREMNAHAKTREAMLSASAGIRTIGQKIRERTEMQRPTVELDMDELRALVAEQEPQDQPGIRKRMRVSAAYTQKHRGSSMRAISDAIDHIRSQEKRS